MAAFFPQGFIDLRDLITPEFSDPPNPPTRRYRLKIVDGVLRVVDSTGAHVILGGGVLSLIDTPSSYAGAESQSLRVNSTADGVEFVPATASNPGEHFQGDSHLLYTAAATQTDEEIQYTRVFLQKDTTIANMAVFATNNTGAAATIRMGIYDQTDPLDFTLEPDTRVAQTATGAFPATNTETQLALTSPFLVPATGYYWLAVIRTSAGGQKQLASSGPVPASFAPVRYEAFVTATPDLPATTGTLTNAGGSVYYVTARE